MPRDLTQEERERSLRWAQERERLFVLLRNAPMAEKVRAYKLFERRRLKDVGTAFEKREARRRIAEDLVMVTSEGPWRLFSPYLRRLEKLGFSTMDGRLLACVMSAKASKGSVAGVRKTAELIMDIERRTRGQKYHPALWEEINSALTRARRFAGLDSEKGLVAGPKRRKKPRARARHSAE
ncbi:hypothetical protein ATI61_101572 [Archangium gephyra]|uniref:Uncharacterized protein n=2 Tax=Archangium gephyra TaxID=48 RepID=A0ABX9KBP2_9BACT|nr:hypothetical protein ATI61_101572 [Archangium gephyra]